MVTKSDAEEKVSLLADKVKKRLDSTRDTIGNQIFPKEQCRCNEMKKEGMVPLDISQTKLRYPGENCTCLNCRIRRILKSDFFGIGCIILLFLLAMLFTLMFIQAAANCGQKHKGAGHHHAELTTKQPHHTQEHHHTTEAAHIHVKNHSKDVVIEVDYPKGGRINTERIKKVRLEQGADIGAGEFSSRRHKAAKPANAEDTMVKIGIGAKKMMNNLSKKLSDIKIAGDSPVKQKGLSGGYPSPDEDHDYMAKRSMEAADDGDYDGEDTVVAKGQDQNPPDKVEKDGHKPKGEGSNMKTSENINVHDFLSNFDKVKKQVEALETEYSLRDINPNSDRQKRHLKLHELMELQPKTWFNEKIEGVKRYFGLSDPEKDGRDGDHSLDDEEQIDEEDGKRIARNLFDSETNTLSKMNQRERLESESFSKQFQSALEGVQYITRFADLHSGDIENYKVSENREAKQMNKMMQQFESALDEMTKYQMSIEDCISLPPDLRKYLIWLTASSPINDHDTFHGQSDRAKGPSMANSRSYGVAVKRDDIETVSEFNRDLKQTKHDVAKVLRDFKHLAGHQRRKLMRKKEFLERKLIEIGNIIQAETK